MKFIAIIHIIQNKVKSAKLCLTSHYKTFFSQYTTVHLTSFLNHLAQKPTGFNVQVENIFFSSCI